MNPLAAAVGLLRAMKGKVMEKTRSQWVMFALNTATTLVLAGTIYVTVPWVKEVNRSLEENKSWHAEMNKWIAMRPNFATVDMVELSSLKVKDSIRSETAAKLDTVILQLNSIQLWMAKHDGPSTKP